VIVDECHHVGAVSFDAILKRTKAKYVLGLTATPIRRDGQQPIIFMQCGPIRHTAARPADAPQDLEVVPRHASHGSICHPKPGFRMCSGTWPTIRIAPTRSLQKSGRVRAGPQGAGADRADRAPRRHPRCAGWA
jgi:hypothetical protein